MVEVEELVLAIKSEGIGEAQSDLEGVEDSMEETADAAGDSAEELAGFSERFEGAIGAAVAALSVGVGGLLSTVPIAGEAYAGLAAIVSALGFQIDQLARQLGAGQITDALFDISAAIFELDGVAGDVAAVFGVIATALSAAAVGAAAWLVKAKGIIGAASAIAGAIKTAATALAGLVAGIGATTAALAVAVAAVVAFAAAYLTNFRGVRDKTNAIIGSIIDVLGDLAAGARAKLMGVIDAFVGLAGDLVEWADNIASDAYQWGTNLIGRFIAGIRETLSAAGDFLGDIEAAVGIDFPSAGAAGDVLGDIGGSVGTVANTAASAFAGRGQSGRGGQGGGTVLDGRQLAESTGRYRSGPARRQGL